jgi:hypothetical protein
MALRPASVQSPSSLHDDETQQLLLSNSSSSIKKSLEISTNEKETNEDETEVDDKGSTLIIAFLLMLVFQLGNRIFGRLQTYPMHNYPLFLNMIMVAVYIPICYMYIIPAMIFTNNITKEQTEIPKYKFAVMGAYDSLAGIMSTFAVNYISNASTIVLVQQSAIPISMVISRYALNSVYSSAQYLGAAVVLFGIVVVLIPQFLDPAPIDPNSPAAATSPSVQMFWIFILVISCVPMCLSSVYKEKALGETEIDIMYLNGWVAIFQFLIAIPLCWPSSAVQNIPSDQIMPNIYDGMKCWMGINSVTAEHNPLDLPLDDCSTAPLFVTTYLFFNVVYNFLIIVILKHGSANIMWMASTVIVPLSNVAFSMKFMPGSQPLRFWDLIGLVVIMLGLVIYRFNASLLAFWAKYRGETESTADEEAEQRARAIAKTVESRQIKYLGINQTEYLQSLVDTRVQKEQMRVYFRSPQQIRGQYLAKVGVPPSPLISMGPGRRPTVDSAAMANYQSTGKSPLLSSSFQRAPSLKAANASLGNSKGYGMLNSPAISQKMRQAQRTQANEV